MYMGVVRYNPALAFRYGTICLTDSSTRAVAQSVIHPHTHVRTSTQTGPPEGPTSHVTGIVGVCENALSSFADQALSVFPSNAVCV